MTALVIDASSPPQAVDDAAPQPIALFSPIFLKGGASSVDSYPLDDVVSQGPVVKMEVYRRDTLSPVPPSSGCPHRVLIYTTCYNVIDGVTLTIRKIEAEILAQGGHVCILTSRSGSESNTHLDGTHPNRTVVFLDKAVLIPFVKDDNNPECNYYVGISMSQKDRKIISHFRPTICHITVPDCASLDVIKFARENDLPLMGTYHSNIVDYMDHYGLYWVKPILSAFFKHNYNFLQTLYVPTPFIKNKLVNVDKLDRLTNMQIWGRGIDLRKFSPTHRSNSFREKLGIRPDEVVILFVGRFVVEKRPDIFANVIRRLYQNGYSFKALVVGAGPYENEMKNLPNTTHVGWLDGHDLSVAYASSDIFLFPGALETFGNVTLEAAGSGLPLVVEEGCSGHLVIDGISGYTCPKDDEEAFYKSTLTLLTDDSQRSAFSAQSRKHSLNYEKDTIMKQMVDNYTAVTDEFHGTYGGNHQVRDLEFKSSDSFRAGTVERPLFLRMAVFFVIFLLFRVTWNLHVLYVSLRKHVSPVFQWVARVLAPLCCVRRKLSASIPLFSVIEEGGAQYVSTVLSHEPSIRNTSQAPKEENAYIKKAVEQVVTIVLLFVRMQSIVVTKSQYCFNYSRQHRD